MYICSSPPDDLESVSFGELLDVLWIMTIFVSCGARTTVQGHSTPGTDTDGTTSIVQHQFVASLCGVAELRATS